MFALYSVVPKADVDCFRKFVLACQHLCHRIITLSDVDKAHNLLIEFCEDFQNRYGETKVTCNMHLHGHLQECVLDFGPIYSFWLFSFERYNGLLGNAPTNKREVEPQIMRRFLRDGSVLNLEKPEMFNEEFNGFISQMSNPERGTLNEISLFNQISTTKLSSRLTDPSGSCWYETNTYIEAPKKSFLYTLTELEVDRLSKVYKYLYGDSGIWSNMVVPTSSHKTSELLVAGEIFGSISSRNCRSSYIRAFWADKNGEILKFKDYGENNPRVGIISEFLKHSFLINGEVFTHWFARVEWCLSFSSSSGVTNYFGDPVECWQAHGRVDNGPASFIPAFRILDKCVHLTQKVKGKDALVVIPRIRNSSF
ncbi:uncharacterized protein [Clytia hemisphaerica]|uniref:uncharacterized protein n=1 Tax=Clytia hemisphaerica TaxID=252671 RepID=UPI0034D4E078